LTIPSQVLEGTRTPAKAAPPPDTQKEQFTFHFTRISRNTKTGPIPVTTTSANSCPTTCRLKGNGCYAEGGPLALHWRAVSDRRRGGSFHELLRRIRELPRDTLWRHNQAGDLARELATTEPDLIDDVQLTRLAVANRGRRGFTYTHYPPNLHNQLAISAANRLGFAVNLSAETLQQADAYAELRVAPVVVMLPIGQRSSLTTPAGRRVVVCPATISDTDCSRCGLCQRRFRSFVIGFPAHGSGARRIEALLREEGAA